MDDDFSDIDSEELYNGYINRTVKKTVTRKYVPVQRDLTSKVLPNQQTYYEEIEKTVTYGPTHHELQDSEALLHYIYPTNYEIRQYQYNIVRRALFENTLCAIPTGMGKTFIASTVMLNFFRWSKKGKVIFMAPTRPLVAQQIKACLGITGIPNNSTAILLDKTRRKRETIWDEKRVFFATPQVVENDLKRGALNPKDVICLVIDEAHRGTGSYAYTKVVQFIDRFNTSYRVLALTATPGASLESVQEVVDKLDISCIELRTEESQDITRYMKTRHIEKIDVPLTVEIENIIEQLGIAILPALKQAIELGLYEDCSPSQINAFKAMQQSQKIVANPSIPEGIKWRNFFILQLLNHMGQMLKRIKIYGIRTFYSYFHNKYLEFTTKYELKKSTNKLAADFYYHPVLKTLMNDCEKMLSNSNCIGHGKLEYVKQELEEFFEANQHESRVIIFTELRESALEIVRYIDEMNNFHVRPHIFIGQAKAKEGFDEVTFTRKNARKGRKKADRLKRQEEEERIDLERKQKKENEKLERSARRTASSEEAQINGMTQKQQKEVLDKFKQGSCNVLVCTSIGEEGLDIGEVDLIICYDTTSSPIKNIQRMGRTGRKRDGNIVLLFSGNEAYKFKKAMDDYTKLQKIISEECITYKKSDRIIPQNIVPKCQKQFITISKEDQELLNMENTEDVIEYATQCMLNSQKQNKKKSKKNNKSKLPSNQREIKQFFMPANVETGIISASKLVNKIKANANGEKEIIPTEPEKKKRKKLGNSLTALEVLEMDSLSSSYVSSEEDNVLFNVDGLSKKDKFDSSENVRLASNNSIDMSKSANGYNGLQNWEESSKSSDEKSTNINIKKEQKQDSLLLTNKIKEEIDQISIPLTKEFRAGLSENEKRYFQINYNSNATISLDVIPFITQRNKISHVPHSTLVDHTRKYFEHIYQNETKFKIEVNRNRSLSRRLANESLHIKQEDKNERFEDVNDKRINNNIKTKFKLETSDATNMLLNKSQERSREDALIELLESDSDF